MKNPFAFLSNKGEKVFFKGHIKKVPWILAKNAFLVIIMLFLANILFGQLLFYYHVIVADSKPGLSVDNPAKFKENIYNTVLEESQRREEAFNNSAQINYSNPFK